MEIVLQLLRDNPIIGYTLLSVLDIVFMWLIYRRTGKIEKNAVSSKIVDTSQNIAEEDYQALVTYHEQALEKLKSIKKE